MSKEYFDLILIVPLELELNEVLAVFPLVENRTTVTHFRCTVDTGISEVSAILVHQDGMGQSAAAKALRLTLREYDCGVAICLGIAGALSDDVSLLDVCYSGDVIDVGENARVTDDESGSLSIDFAPTFYSTGKTLTQAINFSRIVPEIKALHDVWAQQQHDFASQQLKSNGMNETDSSYPKNPPNSMNGAIVCGPVVVKSEVYRKRLSGIQRKLLAVEMEASGIFSAAQELSPDVECITIRGISDNADKGKTALETVSKGAFRSIAARNAATFLKLQLSNRYFVDFVRHSRKNTGDSDQSIDLRLEEADSISTIAKKLADQISDRLRELSPEYKLIPKGYRLPLPRLQKTVVAQESDDEADEPLFALDVVKQGTNLLLTLPRTYPDNSLSYVLSEVLVTCEFENRQILPFVIDGSQIRPPRHGLQQFQPDFLLKKLCENSSVRVVFLIENPPIQSKTKMNFLISELEEFSNSQNIFVVREGVGDLDVASFANSNNLFSYKVGEISFSEIAHFVQKNFGLDGKESDVVALRIRDTLRRFRLAVHPSYFAGVAKELLNALLVANRRSELLQLAVDGYLTFLVADDSSDVTLSRSTRERFLQRLAVEIRVNKRSFTEGDTVKLAEEFAKEFDFPINPLAFVSDFFDKGILGQPDGRVIFYLPFIEHYLIATYLRNNAEEAARYFDLDDQLFDITTFDLYAEIGAADTVIKAVSSKLTLGIAELTKTKPAKEILFTDSIRPRLLAKPNLIGHTQKRVTEILSDGDGEEGRAQKQFILDISDHTQDRVIQERKERAEASRPGTLGVVAQIDRHFFVAVVLLGLGAETLNANTKNDIAGKLIELGALLIDNLTNANNSIDFSVLRQKLMDNGLLEKVAQNGIPKQEIEGLLDDLFGLIELAFLSHPLRRVLEALCEQARSRVLITTIDRVKPKSKTERLLHALWSADLDAKKGSQLFNSLLIEKSINPFLGLTVATHLMSRVFWRHWHKDDRMRLLDLAAETLNQVDRNIDKGKFKRMIATDQKK